MNNNDDNFKVTIKGEVDLTKLDAQNNGLVTGEGSGEMVLSLEADNGEIMRVKVHKLSFEGTKAVTNPNQYTGSNEK